MGTGCPAFWYEFTSERKIIIKGLIDTLALSASNIVFKTTEWTLVGLIVIKMYEYNTNRLTYRFFFKLKINSL